MALLTLPDLASNAVEGPTALWFCASGACLATLLVALLPWIAH